VKTYLRRPGLEPGPITTAVDVAPGWGRYLTNNERWWLWVPAFAGTTSGVASLLRSDEIIE
jgi:hypothetical protein